VADDPDLEAAVLDEVVAGVAGPVAVRSSGLGEDLPDASHAGQYETVLDVRGVEALREAVRTCVASVRGDRVGSYRAARELDGEIGMAVLVQRMVPARAAGVAFSADPVTGDESRARVSAVTGLAEGLVEGHRSADEWTVTDGVATLDSGREEAISAHDALAVAALVRRVAAIEGTPQDVEWALAEGRLWLLQARPVTTLNSSGPVGPGAVPAPAPPGFWRRSTNAPRPLTPMARSVLLPELRRATQLFFRYSFTASVAFEVVDERLYTQHVPVSDPTARAARADEIVAAVRSGEPARTVEAWFAEGEPRTRRDLDRAGGVPNAELTDDLLIRHLDTVRELRGRVLAEHFRVSAAAGYLLGELGIFCERALGWDPPSVLTLASGRGAMTVEPGRALDELARLLRAGQADTAAFAEAADAYRRVYGRRTPGFDLDEPTLAERPDLLLDLVRSRAQVPSGAGARSAPDGSEQADRAVERARRELRERPPVDRERFEDLAARARHAYPVRDDTDVHRHSAEALIRYALLEVGSRLAERGHLGSAPEVFLLEWDEALGTLSAGADTDGLAGRVRDRAAARRSAFARPAPAMLGPPPTAPSPPRPTEPGAPSDGNAPTDPGTPDDPLAAAAWTWRAFGSRPGAPDGPHILRGLAASAGHYRGPVRLLHGEDDFDKLRTGDVLVCPETSAQWSVLFPLIGALVTDTGSLLSHPAIIAREFGVPAVVATGRATSVLHDGQLVEVDGSSGRVESIG